MHLSGIRDGNLDALTTEKFPYIRLHYIQRKSSRESTGGDKETDGEVETFDYTGSTVFDVLSLPTRLSVIRTILTPYSEIKQLRDSQTPKH